MQKLSFKHLPMDSRLRLWVGRVRLSLQNWLWKVQSRCEHCGARESEYRLCQTAYADDNLNHDPRLCDVCAGEYQAYWDEMWNDYNSGRL